MCTGRPAVPRRARPLAVAPPRLRRRRPGRSASVNPEIPDWLAAIVARLHAKDPADRYQSAAEVADLLGQCLAHVQAPETVPLPQSVPFPPRAGGAGDRSPCC